MSCLGKFPISAHAQYNETYQAKLVSEGVLTSLDISGNFVRKEGAEALAAALEATENLTSLDFSYNAGDHAKFCADLLNP